MHDGCHAALKICQKRAAVPVPFEFRQRYAHYHAQGIADILGVQRMRQQGVQKNNPECDKTEHVKVAGTAFSRFAGGYPGYLPPRSIGRDHLDLGYEPGFVGQASDEVLRRDILHRAHLANHAAQRFEHLTADPVRLVLQSVRTR